MRIDAGLARIERFLEWQRSLPTVARAAVATGPLFGLLIGAVFGTIAFWEWGHVHGRPVERAQVVDAVYAGYSEGCGKYGSADVYTLTWNSWEPPAGLPERFTDTEGCDRSEVGDVEDVVRVVSDSGEVHVWVAPAATFGFAVLLTAVGLVGGYLLGFVVGLVQALWVFVRARWFRGKHEAPA